MQCKGRFTVQFLWAGIFSVGTILSVLLMRFIPLNLPLRVAVVLATVAPGVVWILTIIRDMRRLDEMQQRIYLEAVSGAFAGTFLLALMYPVLRKAGFVPEMTPISVAVTMVVLATVSHFLAARRY